MRSLRKLGGLTWKQWKLLTRAFVGLGWTVLNLRLRPVSYLRRRMQAAPRASSSPSISEFQAEEAAWAVALAARYVPGGDHCLAQALAGAALLRELGLPAEIRLGVENQLGFAAHAWVECAGRIVIGAREAERYASLPLPAHQGASR